MDTQVQSGLFNVYAALKVAAYVAIWFVSTTPWLTGIPTD